MRLSAVTANCSEFEGKLSARPLSLLLTFDDGSFARLGVSGDGSRLVMDERPLDEPLDLEECGRLTVEDVSANFAELIGKDVAQVRSLELDGDRVDIRFELADAVPFHIWADGDELWWGGEAEFSKDWLNNRVPHVAQSVSF